MSWLERIWCAFVYTAIGYGIVTQFWQFCFVIAVKAPFILWLLGLTGFLYEWMEGWWEKEARRNRKD